MDNLPETQIQYRLTEALAEKERLAALLTERETLLNRAQTVAGVGSWHLDIPANKLIWSDETYRMFGEVPGTPQTLESFVAHIHPDDLERVLKAWQATVDQGVVYDTEHRILVNGEIRWVRERAEVTRDATGKAMVGIGTVQDITERKQSELALRESETRFRAMFQGAQDGIIIADVETRRFVDASPAACAMLGYSLEELLQLGVDHIHPPSDLQHVHDIFQRQAKEELTRAQELLVMRKDGSVFAAAISVALLEIDGRPHMAGFFRDVSQQHKALTQIKESEERLSLAMRAAKQYWVDMDIPSGVGSVSQEFMQLLGYGPEEFHPTFQGWINDIHPDDRPHVLEHFQKAMKIGLTDVEYRRKTKSGTWLWFHSIGKIVQKDEAGKPIRLVGVHMDITSRKQAETKLNESNERLRLALNSARMGIWEADFISKKISWSPEIFQYIFKGDIEPTEEEFFDSLVHPEDVDGLKEAINRSVVERSAFVAEFRAGGPDSYRWLEDRGHVVLDAENNPVKMIGTVVDVTDRKQAELELISSKHQLELALDASGLSLWDYDFTGGQFKVDIRWLVMLGYQGVDMQWDYATWENRIHPEDLPAMREKLVRHFQGDTQDFESEHRFLHKGGHWVWVQARGKVIQRNREGKPQRMIGTHLDISQRKHLVAEGTDLLRKIESLLTSIQDSSGRTPLQERINQVGVEPTRLTRRQEEVLNLIVSGKTSTQIAQVLNISRGTAIGHRKDLMRKLKVHNTAELTRYAIQHHLLNT